MSKDRAEQPFRFQTLWSMVELTGLFAHNLRELVAHLKTVPGSVIYYHTHHYLRQHQSLSPEPPNDFAYWTTNVLGVPCTAGSGILFYEVPQLYCSHSV
jgi:hypothetical protein